MCKRFLSLEIENIINEILLTIIKEKKNVINYI